MKYFILFSLTLISFAYTLAQKNSTNCCNGNIFFTENKNQWEEHIRYKIELPGTAIFLEDNGITYFFEDRKAVQKLMNYLLVGAEENKKTKAPSNMINYHAYKVNFKNADKNAQTKAYYPTSDYNNYFLGNDESRWASEVRKYKQVQYFNIYNNIDLLYYEKDHLLKYDFIVKQKGDPNNIALEYEGQKSFSLNAGGNLIIKTTVNETTELKPYSYQVIAGDTVQVPAKFKLKGNVVTFVFPKGYNENYELIIDPTLIFSTFSGSSVDNWGYTATYDYNGFVYTAGISIGMGYPTTLGAYQSIFAGGYCDMCITKYDTLGSTLKYSTYLGGNKPEIPKSIYVSNNNELFVFGATGSANYPTTTGAYDNTFNGGTAYTMDYVMNFSSGSDIFVSRFNANGTALLASTFIGGSGNDGLNAAVPLKFNYSDEARGEVFLDKSNNCWIASSTQSTNFPVTANAFQPAFGGGQQDGLIIKMDNSLSTMIWSSYIGGSGNDAVYSLTMDDNDDNVYVSGGTSSANFPTTTGAYKPTYLGGSCDGFIAKIHKNGNSILYSTFYGSNAYDQAYFIDRDKQGYIYVSGQTKATGTTLIHNTLWNTPNGGQFISKLGPQLDTLIWSTAFGTGGGVPDISPTAFHVDLCNNIYLSGWGGATNGFGGTGGLPVTPNAFQSTTDNNDFYMLVVSSDASSLIYASYFGGGLSSEHVDGGTSRFDKKGILYQAMCAGCGGYSDTPTTPGAWSQTNNSNNCNNAVFKMDFGLPLAIADFNLPSILCAPATINFVNTSTSSRDTNIVFFWDFGDGAQSGNYHPTHTYTLPGIYNVQLIVIDSASCNFSDTIVKQIVIISNAVVTLPTDTICFGDVIQMNIPPITSFNVIYTWSPATSLSSTSVPNPIASPLISTDYILHINNGTCTGTFIKRIEVVNLSVLTCNDTTVCEGNVTLAAFANQNCNYYFWSSNNNFTDTLNSSPASNSITLNVNSSKMYYVKVKIQNCIAIDSVHVTVSEVNISTLPEVNICFGIPTQISVTNLNPANPLSYAWSPVTSIISGGNSAIPLVNPQTNTIFNITVTDSLGCQAMAQVATNIIHLQASTQTTDVTCFQYWNGTAEILPYGGSPPYSFVWNNSQTTAQVINLCAGTYNVTILDTNKCELVLQVPIYQPLPFVAFAGSDKSICLNSTIILGGTPAYLGGSGSVTYEWSPVTGIANPNIANPVANPVTSTTYTLTVRDTNNCIATDSVSVTLNPLSAEEICYVEFDTITSENSINWDSNLSANIDSVHIYKEIPANIWNLIGSVSSSQNNFIDMNSDPFNQSYSYKISVKDTCGNETNKSAFHTTVKLLSVYDQGTDINSFTWSSYQGISVSDYYIYGKTSTGTETLIGTVPGNQYYYNYTNPNSSYVKYFVGFNTTTCDNETNHLVRSNFVQATTSITETAGLNNLVHIYPNPVSNELIIEIKGNKEKIGFEILNSIGQIVYKGSLTEKIVIQTVGFAHGVY